MLRLLTIKNSLYADNAARDAETAPIPCFENIS